MCRVEMANVSAGRCQEAYCDEQGYASLDSGENNACVLDEMKCYLIVCLKLPR